MLGVVVESFKIQVVIGETMRARDELLVEFSAIVAPLIARVIELGRGPPSLVDWVAARSRDVEFQKEMVTHLAMELAATLAVSAEMGNRGAETQPNSSPNT